MDKGDDRLHFIGEPIMTNRRKKSTNIKRRHKKDKTKEKF